MNGSMDEYSSVEVRARKGLHWQREKETRIEAALNSDPVDISSLRSLAVSLGGLLHSRLRKRVWPKLAGISVFHIPSYKGPPLADHKDKAQVLLDVNRCGKRIPNHYSKERQAQVQEQLTRVILRLLAENTQLHYYQGLHDVVITLLLVTGEEISYSIMSVLVTHHIRDYLDVNMSRTKVVIGYLQSLLMLEDPELEQFITQSECAYYFSLSWLITWYGHVVKSHEEAYRLMDLFLASHPLMSVYLAAAIVLSRRSDVLSLDCEMSAVHGLLSKLPDDMDYEPLIATATKLFEKHPPKNLARRSGVKLNKSSLISTYSTFLTYTSHQRPDHILKTLPAPPTQSSWWAWLSPFTKYLFSVTTPVLLAMIVYLLYGYLTNRTRLTGLASVVSIDS